MTRGAVYHHFESRAGLFLAVAEQVQNDVSAAVVTAADLVGENPAAQLRAGSHAFLDAITSRPVARILLVDAPAAIGWTQWRALDAAASVIHLRDAIAAVGAVPEDRLDAMTALLSGAMNESALWLAERPEDHDARTAVHAALDTVLSAVIVSP